MVSVNEQKDKQTVIAKVNGENITKEDYSSYYNIVHFLNELNSTTALSDDSISSLKESALDEYVINTALKSECEYLGLSNDDETIQSSYNSIISYIQSKYSIENSDIAAICQNENVSALLTKCGLDYQSFSDELINYLKLYNYYSMYTSSSSTHSFMSDAVAAKINDTQISMPVFNYFMIYKLVYGYMYSGSTPSTEKDTLALYDDTLTYIASAVEITDYAVKKGYSITDEQKTAALNSWLDEAFAYFPDSTISGLLASYYITDEQVNEAKELIASSKAYEALLTEDIADEMTVKRSDVKKYYESNSSSYTASVSAYHILFNDEAAATQAYESIASSPDNFMNLYNAYKSGSYTNAQITQATNLGSFAYADMAEDFSKAAFSMNVGDISSPVSTQYGYHIIYVYDKSEAKTLDNAYDEIAEDYKLTQKSTYAAEQIEKIGKKATVRKKSYRQLPDERLKEYLYDKYNVKVYKNRAVR